MKSIKTLVSDIETLLVAEAAHVEEVVTKFGTDLAGTLAGRLSRESGPASLRMSNLGTPDRKLWYTINRPHLRGPLPASTRLKFLYGDILEEVLLYLAEAAGHTVTNKQAEVHVHGVDGHIDALIDDHLVDVKSASTFSFRKFKDGLKSVDDGFGYRTQLGAYATALDKRSASFLVADKTLGHVTLDTHEFPPRDLPAEIDRKREMLAQPLPPGRCYVDEPDGKSGNRKLGFQCSYCDFKRACWPGLRIFNYSGKPVFLTRVLREPRVQEMSWGDLPE
jgi:hypothetical protein